MVAALQEFFGKRCHLRFFFQVHVHEPGGTEQTPEPIEFFHNGFPGGLLEPGIHQIAFSMHLQAEPLQHEAQEFGPQGPAVKVSPPRR